MPTNPFFNFSAVSESIDPIIRALRVKLRELGCFKKWLKIFFINRYILISSAISKSIDPISELKGLN